MQLPLNKIKKYFEDKPIKRAYLFGSYSKGEETETSDIDILVELDHSKPIGLLFVQMIIDLEKILKKKVDLLTNKSISPYMKSEIDKHKKMIYEKK